MAKGIVKAIYDGELKFGNINISCAVLENGQRVLVERSTANALGVKGGGAHWRRKRQNESGAFLPEYVSAKYLQPYIDEETHATLLQKVTYISKSGKETEALPAENLPEICDIWIKADQSGALTEGAKNVAELAYIIMKGLATVGIVALVDEATGHQDARTKDALAKILEQYLARELYKWVKTFPDEFYKQLFRLRGWQYSPDSIKRPALVGKLTNNLIYDRLAPGVLNELKELNPVNEKGTRKHHHHRWLTRDFGHPRLKEHLWAVIQLMRASANWNEFSRLINRALPKYGDHPLFEGLEKE